MDISFKKNKEKQIYSSKLLYKAPNIHETYKRMLKSQKYCLSALDTSQSFEGIVNQSDGNITDFLTPRPRYIPINSNKNIQILKEEKKNNEINKANNYKLSYLGFLKSKGFPFKYDEQRFKWQNTHINSFQRTKKHFPINIESKEEFKYKRQKKKINLSTVNDNSFRKTSHDILNIEINNKNDKKIIEKKHKKGKKYFQKFLNIQNPKGLAGLIKKTPLKETFKGVKRIKRLNSYELNLFGKDYPKFEIPKTCKKHFIQGNDDNDIFDLRPKSTNNIKNKERKTGKKYEVNGIDINPISWRILNHKKL